MGKLDRHSNAFPERASDHFGALKNLPSASFRGIDCSLLAEQYRKVRALETIEPELPGLLSVGTEAALRTDLIGSATDNRSGPGLRTRR